MTHLKKIRFIPILSYILLCLILSPNKSLSNETSRKFKHFSVADGLSQSSVFSILHDSEGYMWFGTRSGGLNKYDGYSFTTYRYDEDNPYCISGNEVISLFEDREGTLWAGTRNHGLNRFDKETERFYRYEFNETDSTTLPNNTINCICEDLKGNLWFGTNDGLCTYNREQNNFIRYDGTKGLNPGDIKSIALSSEGCLWIGGKGGLILYDTHNSKIIHTFQHDKNSSTSISHNYVTSVIEDRSGKVWLGTHDHGVNCLANWESGVFTRFKHNPNNPNSITSDVIRTIHEDNKGRIWIGTKVALEQLNPDQQEKTSPKFIHHLKDPGDKWSLSQNSIFSFYRDKNNDFWIGTYSGGVNYLYAGSNAFAHYKNNVYQANSLNHNVISSFAKADKGIWVGTEGGGLNLFNINTNKSKHFTAKQNTPNSLSHNNIKALLVDKDKNLWIGTYKGLDLYDKTKNSFIHFMEGHNIYTIEDGVANEIWIGTVNNLFKLNKANKSIKTYSFSELDSNSISSNLINKVFKDKHGRIWVGTKNGLNLYDREKDNFKRYFHVKNDRNSLSHSHISSICQAPDGTLWIGTLDGISQYDYVNDQFIQWGKKDGLHHTSINNIIADDYGYIWISTNKGLSRFKSNISTNENDPNKKLNMPTILNFDTSDGLQGNVFKQNSSYKDENGITYLGGTNGFNCFNPKDITKNTEKVKVGITDFKLFNKSAEIGGAHSPLKKHISQTRQLTLTHQHSVISFDFVALSFISPEKNQYAYFMEGFDKGWNYVENKREATYTNLPAGKYTFKVKASNNHGVWNEEGASIQLTILPPWWETIWFRVLLVLFVFGLAYAYYSYKVKELKQEQLILEQKVEERTHALQVANHELEESKEEVLQQNNQLELQNENIEKAYESIEKLSRIGNEITMSFSVELIIETTHNILRSMMQVPTFSIGIYNNELERLDFKGTKVNNKTVANYYYSLHDKSKVAVYCFNNQVPILVKDLYVESNIYAPDLNLSKEELEIQSLVYLPLNVKNKKIGVISVQSPEKETYNQYHLNILKNIGAYTAIALDNANAYLKIEKQADELQAQKLELEETNASKDKFYSILSHDLKNPLGTMLGFLELLKTDYHDYEEEQRMMMIDSANESAQLIFKFVQNLLQWSSAQRGVMKFTPEKLELRNLLSDELALLDEMLLKKEIQLELNTNQLNNEIFADKNMLSIIFRNLVSNAIKFTPKGGKITVNTEDTDNATLFKIADTGIGIPNEVIDKIFRIDADFTRTGTENEKGTGLGLSLCRDFVEKHQGKIWVESMEGKGTQFYFTIPKEEHN